jgi:hypothetical protein
MTFSKRSTGATLALLGLIAAVAAAFLLSGAKPARSADSGVPASKAAIAIDELIDLSAIASPETPAGDTGWQPVLKTQIKTANQKDLLFDVAMQCGIVTDTTVKSAGGNLSSTTARANMAVRVLVDGEPALPANSIDATKANAEGVVYCDRIQTLAAKFAGLNCQVDPLTGAVTCADPEELRLLLRTMDAHAFNFAMTDVSSGVHNVVVEAKAAANVSFDDGNLAGAEAFAGAGSLVVEEVRLVKGAEPLVDLQ